MTRPNSLRDAVWASRAAMMALVGGLGLLLAPSCASLPRPRVFTEVDAVRASAASTAAQKFAPQAFLAAEQLRAKAHAAYEAKNLSAAQVLGEHTIAAYEHAFVLSRLARAEQRLARTELEVERAEGELAKIDEQQRRVAAEADAFELRIRVARELEPLPTSGPAGPDREQARRDAARSLLLQARLTCTATRLLSPDAEGLAGAVDAVVALERLLEGGGPAPIDEALRARSGCLSMLTRVRRASPPAGPEASAADALLTSLGEEGSFFVYRDDRGVIVLLHDLFTTRNELTSTAAATLARLGRLARDHARFPVLVVLHDATARGSKRQADDRARQLVEALRQGGASRVESALAGNALPLVEPGRRGADERNSRVEIVFVAPTP
ncbi:MAG: hypothetical protein JW751_32240 [Polyangiaceae bacterium]|nr:hypothetical protein [Polyangiaceae bacterium]